uniref:Putative reverse transcriptase domain-containing protein n=1 Tax=Tanacetum cinerariifolium TaxID=118510 RepID=A0A6L2P3P7_TANCI|nr:putative reverse transcriptase domain-containing protein [Tanacetum cinerariifolium]
MEFWCQSSYIVMEDLLCGFCRRCKSVRNTARYEYGLSSSNGWTKRCRSPVLWAEIGKSRLIGLELVQEMTDRVVLIKEKLKAARDHQKSYADNRRKPLEFEVGDRVLLKVSPWKGVIRFGKKGKLAPSKILIVKVRWNSKRDPEFTWEREDHMKARRVEALVVDGIRRRGRPKLRWEDKVKLDMKELLLSEDMTSDRNE